MRIVSKRPTRKHANEAAKGIFPVSARPAATPIMFASAIPTLKARSGYFFAKPAVIVDFERSASSVTMRSSLAPRSSRASPNAARVALAGMAFLSNPFVPLLLLLERGELFDDRARRAVASHVLVPGRIAHAEEVADGADRFRGLRRLAVPLGVVLHPRNPFALHGVGDDERRPPFRGFGLIEG